MSKKAVMVTERESTRIDVSTQDSSAVRQLMKDYWDRWAENITESGTTLRVNGRRENTVKHRSFERSEDIRWRIIWLRIVQDLTFRQIAKKLCIGFGTVARIWDLFQLTGNVSVQSPFDNNRMHLRVLDEYHELLIIGIILECPTVYLHELRVVIQKATNVDVSIPTLCRLLKRYGMTRKKIQRIALQRSSILRAEFMAHMQRDG